MQQSEADVIDGHHTPPPFERVSISVGDIVSFVRKYFLRFLLLGIVMAIIGYALSYTMTPYYTSEMTLLPEQEDSKMSFGMKSLVGSALGMTDAGTEAIRPELYPDIMASTPFCIAMLKEPVTDQKGVRYTSYRAFLDSTQEKPSFLMSLLPKRSSEEIVLPKSDRNPDVLVFSKTEEGYMKLVRGTVSAAYDRKTGAINVQTISKDPMVAAIITDKATKYLIEYVKEYRTKKSADRAAFLAENVSQARERLKKAEYAYRSYRDNNRNPFLNVARMDEERLASEVEIARNVYNTLTQEYERTRLKVLEEQPVLMILEPAKFPLKTSKPRRVYIALGLAVFSCLVYFIYIFVWKEKVLQRLLNN